MPWKAQPMSGVRFALVHHVPTGGVSVTQACQRFQISRKTGSKWLQRYRQAPEEPLVDRSRSLNRLGCSIRIPPYSRCLRPKAPGARSATHNPDSFPSGRPGKPRRLSNPRVACERLNAQQARKQQVVATSLRTRYTPAGGRAS